MSLHAVVTSDWHLMGMAKLFPNPLERQMVEINKPYAYAIENSIEHVLVPGDMSDVPRLDEHNLIALVTKLLQFDDHIHTYYILGNHDFAGVHKSSCDVLRVMAENGMFKRFHLFFKPTNVKIDGINVCFMPFPHTKVLRSPNGKPPLVVAHIETAGAVGDNGRVLKTGHDEKFRRQPGDFIVSGHLHQHQYLKEKRTLYGGTLYQKNFGESLPKGFLDLKATYLKSGTLKVEHEFINSHPNFILETRLIQSADEWETLSKDDGIRYKILVAEGVIVPKGITAEYPNIVYINGTSSKTQINMDGSIDNGSTTLKDLPTFSLTTGLQRYLKAAELDTRQIKRAKEFVREARSALHM